jgi:transposase
MQMLATTGLDIAKSIIQFHGIDVAGNVGDPGAAEMPYVLAFFEMVPSCLIGIKACATSHHLSREPQPLGHAVRLIPPATSDRA